MGSNETNLLVVCVDCLRQDFTATDRARTPFIDSLAGDGIEYRELYSTATTTTPCVASMLTGTYSERNGINSLRHCDLSEDVRTAAELLGEAGFETAAMVTGPLVEETGIQRGFDHYWYREPEEELVGDWFDTAVRKLDDLPEPFFCYLHLWEVHEPIWVPPEAGDRRFGETSYQRMLCALDRALERFVAEAPEDTLVAFTGDHAESISWRWDPGSNVAKIVRDVARYRLGLDTRPVERRLNRVMDRFSADYPDHYVERGHGQNVFDFVANVPFLLSGPGIDPATVDAQARQIDVLPTLLDYVSLPVPEFVQGESLLPPEKVEDRDAYLRACGESLKSETNWQRGLRADGHKYVEYPDRDWDPELYDLSEDPLELTEVSEDDPATLRRMQDRLPEEELMEVAEVDIEDRLEDLGYV
ncbi:sulfatase [Halobacteriales archaeon QS_8_69_26]|nr:MAG: sulfatase [Halobacteriales archaeon QS_8_69_26]